MTQRYTYTAPELLLELSALAVEPEARRANCRRLRLCTGVGNDKAKRFYEKNG